MTRDDFKKLPREEKVRYNAMVLAEYLADGAKPYTDVKDHCAHLGLSRFELKAARKELGIKTINTGTTWLWEVPADA